MGVDVAEALLLTFVWVSGFAGGMATLALIEVIRHHRRYS